MDFTYRIQCVCLVRTLATRVLTLLLVFLVTSTNINKTQRVLHVILTVFRVVSLRSTAERVPKEVSSTALFVCKNVHPNYILTKVVKIANNALISVSPVVMLIPALVVSSSYFYSEAIVSPPVPTEPMNYFQTLQTLVNNVTLLVKLVPPNSSAPAVPPTNSCSTMPAFNVMAPARNAMGNYPLIVCHVLPTITTIKNCVCSAMTAV
jgi:hypothetical protein